MYGLKKFFGKFWIIFVIGIMLAIFMTIMSSKTSLNVYTGGNSAYVIEKETDATKNFDSIAYVNSTTGLSMRVPADWQYVVKDGYDTYVHPASASSLQIQVVSYYPMVNNATAESLYQTYQERGYELTEFERLSETSYYTIYKGNGLDGITDFIEYVFWDRSNVVKVVMTFNESNYEKLSDIIWGCIDSIEWVRPDPIPEGLYLYYSSYGDFEFAIPTGWATEIADNTFYAVYEGTNAYMTVDVLEDTTSLSDFSQIDYTNYLSSGRSNFALTQFYQEDGFIYSEAIYYAGDIQMGLMQYYISNGVYHYIITYEFPMDMGESIVPIAQSALEATRIFYVPSEEELGEVESEIENTDAVFTPEGLEVKSDLQKRGDELMEEGAENESSSADEGSVSSFASALVTVAEISDEKAEEIASVWEGLGMGMPTYAQAVNGNDQMLIVLIIDSSGTNYYLYLTRDGDLTEMHMNSEDGPTINF